MMIKKWLKAALIRAIKTVAQCAASLIGVGAVMSDINWPMVGSAALLAGILSLLTSVAGLPEVDELEAARKETAEEAARADENEERYLQQVLRANAMRDELLYNGMEVPNYD